MSKTFLHLCLVLQVALAFTSQVDVVINKLDGITSTNLVYSGLLPISDNSTDSLFFTYYSAKDAKKDTDIPSYPLLVVVGSPGSSAQYFNLAGMGPLSLKADMTTMQNSKTVTNFANVMFVDLLGNGFSFVSNTSNLPTKSQGYGRQIAYAINALNKQSLLGQSKIIVLAGEGTFLRSLIGLSEITGLAGIIHFSAWPELIAVIRYYGIAGIDLKIFTNAQRVAIEATLGTCYNNVQNKNYSQAHNCYDSILNFVEAKTKNVNVFNTKLGSNLTEHLPMIQYYFSQPNVVTLFKAPTTYFFESQSNWAWSKTFVDFAINKTGNLSQFMKDYLAVKHWFISGYYDYIAYKQSLKFWLENQLIFLESSAFKAAKLSDVVVDGTTVGQGKQVKQVKYTELFDCGHYIVHDQPGVFSSLLKEWLSSFSIAQQ